MKPDTELSRDELLERLESGRPADICGGPVVVLGGGGFIGSNLARRLNDMGCDVTAVDIDFPDWRKPPVHCVKADLSDMRQCADVMSGAGLVFHLAADMGGVGYFHSDADLNASLWNGRITANVAAAAADTRVFYASSACAYPIEGQMVPGRPPKLSEDLVGYGTPDALYGAEKLHGLRIMDKVADARVGLFHTIFGPYQEHEGRRMKFPAAVTTKAIRARETGALELWGDGTQMRSYLYVDDAVDRIITVATSELYEGPVNIGAEGAVTCRSVAELVLELAHTDADIVNNPAEPSGVLARDCCNAKFDALYGPGPQRSEREGFGQFMDWLDSL